MALTDERYNQTAALLPPEPSRAEYWLDKGFSDLGATIREAIVLNRVTRGELITELYNGGFIHKILWGICFLSFLVAGVAGTVIFAFIHSAVIMVVMVLVYILFGLSRALDAWYRKTRKMEFVCEQCKHVWPTPGYVCPKCGKVHSYLRPNTFGFYTHVCECGQKLPCTFFASAKGPDGSTIHRSDLEQCCPNPNCAHSVASGEARTMSIPVVGGRSVGKTSYIAALAHDLVLDRAAQQGYDTDFLDDSKRGLFSELEKIYQSGDASMTSEDSDVKRASAFSLSVFVRKDGLDPDRLIHLYDVAGETFLNNDEHEDQLQYAYAEGAVLLVDPMSIPDLASELEEGLSATDAAVSGRSNPDDVLASLIEKVKSVAKPDRQGRFAMPLAVVLSKTDLPGLDEKIGQAACDAYLAANPECPAADAQDAVLRDFLLEYGMGNFLTSLKASFRSYRFFAASAVGHERLAGAYDPKGVVEPFAWIAGQADPTFATAISLPVENAASYAQQLEIDRRKKR